MEGQLQDPVTHTVGSRMPNSGENWMPNPGETGDEDHEDVYLSDTDEMEVEDYDSDATNVSLSVIEQQRGKNLVCYYFSQLAYIVNQSLHGKRNFTFDLVLESYAVPVIDY